MNLIQTLNKLRQDIQAWVRNNFRILAKRLNDHEDKKNNPHGVTLNQLGVTSTAAELNHVGGITSSIQTQLNKKANDFSIGFNINNAGDGNPRVIKFASISYSNCTTENGVMVKFSMVSGHGNGVNYVFLQDVIIRIFYNETTPEVPGIIYVDNFKYYGDAVDYEGARQYGDIFWVHDTTNKVVNFYCLMGQYSNLNMTPYKRLTYSSGGVITQYNAYTGDMLYSSGTKEWANNSEIALANDIPTNYVGYTTNNDISIAGTTKPTYTFTPPNPDDDTGFSNAAAYFPEGIVMGGSAQSAGFMVRGICGITTPSANTGACNKENLFINYDGTNTYNSGRQLVLQAGSVGTHYGNNVYQYAAVRGDALKNYCDANYMSASGTNTEDWTITLDDGEKIVKKVCVVK